jgi:hypothetical protein
MCDDVTDLMDWLGEETGNKLRCWLQPIVNKQFKQWTPNGCCRSKFGVVVFRGKQDGLAYRATVTLTLPDPLIAYDPEEGCYLATLSLERMRLLTHQPWQGGTDLDAVHEE